MNSLLRALAAVQYLQMIYTIGHSIRTEKDFLALLQQHSIDLLIDIRTIPHSRRNPQFNSENLEKSLRNAGIGYLHLLELGGLRKPSPLSKNTGWENPGFRGYADHMSSEEFERGIERVIDLGSKQNIVLMCAEAFYGKCHRMVLSDALVIRNVIVLHILDEKQIHSHALTSFAHVEGKKLTYPPEQASLDL